MTAKEAYKRVMESFDDGEEPIVVICRDYEDFFGFIFAPEGTGKGDQVYVGNEMICVDKEHGRVNREDYSDICEKEYGLFVPVNELLK